MFVNTVNGGGADKQNKTIQVIITAAYVSIMKTRAF